MGQIQQAVTIAVNLCKKWEGFSATPYICPAGYPTIGYGTVYKPDGTKVTMLHSPITKETAEAWLVSEIVSNYLASTLRVSPNLVNYPKTLGAITSFVYNLGITRYKASTLKKRINENNFNEAISEIRKWVYGSGKRLPGLVKRREEEASLIRSEQESYEP